MCLLVKRGTQEMIKRIVKHGGGKAIAIDKAILEILKIDESTDLEVTTDGVGLKIYPKTRMDDKTFHAAFEQAMKEQASTIEALSR